MTLVTLDTPEAIQVQTAIKIIHYTFPALCFFYFVLALTITVCTLQNTQSLRIRDQNVRRDVVIALLLVVTSTYVYVLASTLVFGIQSLALIDTKFPVWYPYYVPWFVAIIAETTLLVVPNIFDRPSLAFEFVVIAIQALRIATFIIVTALYFGLRNSEKQYENLDAERQSLLRKKLAPKQGLGDSTKTGNGYGATITDTTDDASEPASEDSWVADRRKAQEKIATRLKQDGNWFTYAKGFAIFFPFIWPVNSKGLQLRAILVGMCLLASNALNVLVPNQMGIMIDSLMKRVDGTDPARNIWLPVICYAVLLFASSGACIGWLRKWLWMPLEQYSYDALSTASHAHILSLSSDFHDSKTSSDLTQAVSGGRSVADLLETVCFQVIPMFIDLAVAFTYLWSFFGPYMGFIMAVTAISYLYITTKLVAVRAEKRREYVTVYRREWTVGQQSLDGWGTASLFNMIPYERHRYACAVKEHMQVKRAYELSSQSIGAAQGLVMTFGLLGALFLGVYQVSNGQSIGKFTTLLVYWAQLQSPLVFFSSMYRTIAYSLMDAERLLELFQTKPTIVDLPHAKTLKFNKGEIKFDSVSFAYDERKPTLKDVTFTVPAGKTVAIVGETGGGKSTILKLIHRFYDIKSGRIMIDGQDLRDITLNSLRDKIGVVPQDPMLFNDSIMNNVRYARPSATDLEVYEACKAAAVHDKIMSFPDGYNSKVGDRGVKLSGGEKQRIAIARAILKRPEIMLLDEATSAVDTDTEHLIQKGLRVLCQDRTTIIVAHRLSTIMRADQIIVVMNGEILEEGTHDELIHAKGKYLDLWSKQVYVKPAGESTSSQIPKMHDTTIINDLAPSRQKAELAKITKTVHTELATHQDSNSESVINTEPSTNNSKQSHINRTGEKSRMSPKTKAANMDLFQREGSRLKPEAPEFVPLTPKAVERKTSKIEAKNAAKEQKKLEKQEKEEQKQQRKLNSSLGKRSFRHLGRHDGADGAGDDRDSTAEELPSIDSTEQVTEGDSTRDINKRSRRSRNPTRRQTSKSEPGHLDDSVDGTHELDMAGTGSGEGQLLLPGQRRVSAPGDVPSAQHKSRNRSNRSRHWRLKSRIGDRPELVDGSGTATTDEGSSSTQSHPVPTRAHPLPIYPPRVSTSSEDTQASNTTIRFAPGF
ncbi:Adenosinetriphosphatase [Hyphodiscus hymeniophilus]|uniref:Adenosinetriphosphatase n=1 Tax=Hyphodiscus hymeniophilus TaxID=353542 RepID=A0A9P6VKA9_9HELO|nr:Adenosinetriphosphatase [Hyphodiscus hymeniophilus]